MADVYPNGQRKINSLSFIFLEFHRAHRNFVRKKEGRKEGKKVEEESH